MKSPPLDPRVVFTTLVVMRDELLAKNTRGPWYQPRIRVADVCERLKEHRERVKPVLKALAKDYLIRFNRKQVGSYQTIEVLKADEATKLQDHAYRREAVERANEMINTYVKTQLGKDWQDETAMLVELRIVTDENDVVQTDKVRCELTFDAPEERLLDIVDLVASKLNLRPRPLGGV